MSRFDIGTRLISICVDLHTVVLYIRKSKQGRRRNVATTKKDPTKPINVIIITMKLGYFGPDAYYAHAQSRAV